MGEELQESNPEGAEEWEPRTAKDIMGEGRIGPKDISEISPSMKAVTDSMAAERAAKNAKPKTQYEQYVRHHEKQRLEDSIEKAQKRDQREN